MRTTIGAARQYGVRTALRLDGRPLSVRAGGISRHGRRLLDPVSAAQRRPSVRRSMTTEAARRLLVTAGPGYGKSALLEELRPEGGVVISAADLVAEPTIAHPAWIGVDDFDAISPRDQDLLLRRLDGWSGTRQVIAAGSPIGPMPVSRRSLRRQGCDRPRADPVRDRAAARRRERLGRCRGGPAGRGPHRRLADAGEIRCRCASTRPPGRPGGRADLRAGGELARLRRAGRAARPRPWNSPHHRGGGSRRTGDPARVRRGRRRARPTADSRPGPRALRSRAPRTAAASRSGP